MLPAELDNRDIKRHAGTDDNQVSRFEKLRGMSAEIHPDTSIFKFIKIIQELGTDDYRTGTPSPLEPGKTSPGCGRLNRRR